MRSEFLSKRHISAILLKLAPAVCPAAEFVVTVE